MMVWDGVGYWFGWDLFFYLGLFLLLEYVSALLVRWFGLILRRIRLKCRFINQSYLL